MTASRLAIGVGGFYTVVAAVMGAEGGPPGWLILLILVAAGSMLVALRWAKQDRQDATGLRGLNSLERRALRGKACLADVIDAAPRLEDTR